MPVIDGGSRSRKTVNSRKYRELTIIHRRTDPLEVLRRKHSVDDRTALASNGVDPLVSWTRWASSGRQPLHQLQKIQSFSPFPAFVI